MVYTRFLRYLYQGPVYKTLFHAQLMLAMANKGDNIFVLRYWPFFINFKMSTIVGLF